MKRIRNIGETITSGVILPPLSIPRDSWATYKSRSLISLAFKSPPLLSTALYAQAYTLASRHTASFQNIATLDMAAVTWTKLMAGARFGLMDIWLQIVAVLQVRHRKGFRHGPDPWRWEDWGDRRQHRHPLRQPRGHGDDHVHQRLQLHDHQVPQRRVRGEKWLPRFLVNFCRSAVV